MIHCQKCKTENPADAQKCSKCSRDLLPGSGLGERAGGFGCLLTLAVLSIVVMYFCYDSMSSSGASAFQSLLLLIAGPVLSLFFLLCALVVAFRKVPLFERYQKRAERHIKLDPGQAISDFTLALANLPQKTSSLGLKLLKQRADLYTQQEMAHEAQADYEQALEMANALFTSLPQKEKMKYLEERIDLLGKLGRQEESDLEGLNYTYLVEKSMPPKKIAMGALEGIEEGSRDFKRNELHKKRKEILDRGLYQALGYCHKCKTAVELDSALLCKVNLRHTKITSIRFVKVADVERVKQEISASPK